MQKLKIKKENLVKLLDGLKDKTNLLAPQTDKYGDTYFTQVKDAAKIQLNHFKPVMPAVREVLFGQVADMIRFKKGRRSTKIKSIDQSEGTVIFGLPSCDLAGIIYCDIFFTKREFVDFYYQQARKKLTLISLVCTTPPNESCFCAAMNQGPFLKNGFDLQLTDLGNGYYFAEVGGRKGKALISDQLFEEATDEDIKQLKVIQKKAKQAASNEMVNKKQVLEKMKQEPLKEKMIQKISDKCISCGACNYACPTCTCFNVVDHAGQKEGVRKRILDSCILSGYFRMAGGHNPKGDKNQRTRNRYYCKLTWDQEKFGDSGCVGCGRCLDSCPVDIDIKEVMQ
ncbi:4Fe-4S dicluster domain-containing protein [Candidatus Margulisiibacteriota bacterium]